MESGVESKGSVGRSVGRSVSQAASQSSLSYLRRET